ncbi:hypothetical protein TRFO_05628 [Tritrichomonas foetus]|uniref:Uncharacterized protein n=1 Tax=Tritrichomonas foetus TaxID=1144522 RepID=A0A1J4K6B0_9EUKA|nr:hypothetical protein TRFO_05628 [Tritrichomonas foetus]|eukprot:OHT06416.1 hypothetical protein TRFO_05628 [Tritrichomonas foetus]
MKATSSFLIEATINAIDDLEKRKITSTIRRDQRKGIGVRAIHNALQTAQLDNRTTYELRIQHSDVFDALCTSIESLSIFQFEGADSYDIYFSLKGPKEEMIAIAKGIQPSQPFDKQKYEIHVEPAQISNFETLMQDMDNTIRNHASLHNANEELRRREKELQQQLIALQSPVALRQQIAAAQDAIAKWSAP